MCKLPTEEQVEPVLGEMVCAAGVHGFTCGRPHSVCRSPVEAPPGLRRTLVETYMGRWSPQPCSGRMEAPG